jgi:hypothetical protein
MLLEKLVRDVPLINPAGIVLNPFIASYRVRYVKEAIPFWHDLKRKCLTETVGFEPTSP